MFNVRRRLRKEPRRVPTEKTEEERLEREKESQGMY